MPPAIPMKKTLSSLLACAFAMPVAAWAQGAGQGPTGTVEAGERKVAMCIGCHGIPGYQASYPEVHKVPMISGQTAGYIAASLAAYRKGDRKHPTMRSIAASLTDQDIADLSAFYAAHGRLEGTSVPATPAAPSSTAVATLLQRGACVSCHGTNFNTPIDANTPKIAGQHADYLYVALKAYKTEANPLLGRTNPVMAGQAKQFSNAELKAMAQYIASLPGELKVVPQERLHAAGR
jgi:cytochrome c553